MSRRKLLFPALLLLVTAIFLLGGGGPASAGKQAKRVATAGAPPSKVKEITGRPLKAVAGGREGNAAPLVPVAGAISFSAPQYSVRESDGAATVTLKRTGGTDNQVVARVTATNLTTSRADHRITSGSLDSAFAIGTGTEALAIQPDGKIIAGYLRLNPDGSIDNTFHAGPGPNFVRTITIQPDGKIIEGGNDALVRFNSDGSTDSSFNAAVDLDPTEGPTYRLRATAVQSDGKILIGGFFNTANGFMEFTRLNPDGSLDSSFSPNSGVFFGDVFSLAVQPDGKILIEGTVRLNADGSRDNTFNSGLANGIVRSIALQPDGKIIIGGDFTKVGGVSRNGIARLNSDGSLDTSFNPGTGVTGSTVTGVQTVSLQPDGRVFIGGDFAFFNGTPRNYMARLNSDGSLDTSFDPGLGGDNAVRASVVQPGGE